MESHPIPRQITTFEFKLIGFLTLRQFIYLAVFFPVGVIFFYLTPLPLLNILFALIPVLLGLALAFVPYNDRPLDIWIKNFIKKLFSPSQYYYRKKNQPPAFLKDVFIYSTPQVIKTHLEAQKKLSSYLSQKNQPTNTASRRQQIHQLIRSKPLFTSQKTKPPPQVQSTPLSSTSLEKKPFIFGVVKNNKNLPLLNSLISWRIPGRN